MGKVINMNGQEKESLSIREALPYFPGRNGHDNMTYRSFKQKIYRGEIPTWVITKVNGMHWIDKKYLMGFNNTAA